MVTRERTERSGAQLAALGLFALVAGAHVAGSVLAYEVNNVTSQGVSLFPAAGVTVAALLLVPRRSWWVVLSAAFVAELLANLLLIDEVAGTALGSALSNVVEPALGAWLVLAWLGRAPQLQRPRELLAFLSGAVVCGPVLGTLVGVTSTRFTPGHAGFFNVAGRWFVGDGLGVLIVGSLVLAWAMPDVSFRRTAQARVEALALAVVLVLVTALAFWGSVPALAYATLPVLAWAALRFGIRGSTAAGSLVAALADWATIQGHGLFAELSSGSRSDALWQLQLFLGIVVLTGVLLASQVSELDVAARALRAAEATRRFQLLLEASPDPIVILRNDGSIDYVNRQFQQLVGIEGNDLVGTMGIALLPAQSRDAALAAFAESAHAAEGSRTVFELLDVLGTDRGFEAAVSPIGSGRQRVLVTTLREITERRKAEAATRQALLAAEQATQVKSEFLAMMSHEIRTPMNGVTGLVDVLARMSLEGEQRQIVGTIRESAEALLAVIDDILDFSKIEAGKLSIEQVPFDLRDVVDGVTELLASGAAAKSVELSCAVAAEVPDLLVGDAHRVRQVLFNLLGNAVKFTGEGQVRLTVEAQADGVRLVVSDTGIGMNAEQRAQLFEPFVQAEQSTTREYGGSGLGLAIVLRLVGLMDGTITVDSDPTGGSTFTVQLALPPAPPVPVELPLAGVRVLLLAPSADATSVAVAVSALRRAGAEVTAAAGKAIAAVITGRVDHDVLYVTRPRGGSSVDGLLADLVQQQDGVVVVCDRSVAGTSWLPNATPVATSAVTGRSIVRAVALACGRMTGHELPVVSAAAEVAADAPLVLVAEDHPTNRIVIRRQLAMLGFRCEVAVDGVQALEMLEEQEFALLLADCHMPRLDGYALTRTIRAAEVGTVTHLPIVALTASALPSEADRCLDAGMDLVLTKPVALEALDRALSTWLRPDAAPAARLQTAAVDLSVLRALLGDDPLAVREVSETFVRSAADTVSLLDAAEAAGDAGRTRSAAHRLLGGARTMGAFRLATLCEQVEQSEGTPDPALLARLRAELDLALDTLTSSSGAGDQ